jgi:hypothetical protein
LHRFASRCACYSGAFGTACNGVGGPVILSASGPFAVGVPFLTTSLYHQPFAIGLAILSLSNTYYATVPLPLLLDRALGTSNCFLNVSADVTFVAFADAVGTMSFGLVPTPPFAGRRIFAQHAALEAVPGGFSFSNGAFIQS